MIMIGVPYDICGTMNPHKLEPFEKTYEDGEKKKDYEMWYQGMYFYSALNTVASNVLSVIAKKHPHEEYLKAPLHVLKHENDIATGKIEMSEVEKNKAIDDLFSHLGQMQKAFENTHKQSIGR